ncbi:hypothetical protein M430DRAFT_239921 [Amorphotheca resinae ATCC 22711]|uniref:Uncharacterized protein n=1 Tax=Amorphotheca resinae ATCC 22711 TaxID=857342 RepID=A0A2T3B1Q2_AMORE|nr:hypothetical protein M430DRAFT_239921 [Amorphotheca resinae ATCC 22711]PSS18478.1 hypothetical protein M430DRAFT_239921 [Amorphotheca resinae ATCC 22711]
MYLLMAALTEFQSSDWYSYSHPKHLIPIYTPKETPWSKIRITCISWPQSLLCLEGV